MEHLFVGKHLIANYIGCNHHSLTNIAALYEAMEEGIRASGATILGSTRNVFVGGGFSMAILLSESHATIHTYPEVNSCFVDMFTCGNVCEPQKFNEVLQRYLKPTNVLSSIVLRDDGGYLTKPEEPVSEEPIQETKESSDAAGN